MNSHEELIERLLRPAGEVENANLCVEAATALRTLLDEIARKDEALRPIAREAKRMALREDQDRYSFAGTGLSYGDIRRTIAALESNP